MKEWVIALISGLVGSVVGAIATSWTAYHFTNKHRLEVEEKQKKNLMKALSIELSTVWETYMEITGNELEKCTAELKETALILMAQSYQNYLIVYDNSTNQIGLLDSEVAWKVIGTYTNIKTFIDDMILFETLEDPFEKQRFLKYLIRRHFKIKAMIEDTISSLNNAI